MAPHHHPDFENEQTASAESPALGCHVPGIVHLSSENPLSQACPYLQHSRALVTEAQVSGALGLSGKPIAEEHVAKCVSSLKHSPVTVAD